MMLYYHTGGAGWLRSANWTHGEPCENNWEGVYCCPEQMPYLIPLVGQQEVMDSSQREQQRCSSVNPFARRRRTTHILDEPPDWDSLGPEMNFTGDQDLPAAHFCNPGTSYGDDRDLSRCVVVRIDLSHNNLTGNINFEVDVYSGDQVNHRTRGFNALQELNLEDNNLVGDIPVWFRTIPALQAVKMGNNLLSLDRTNQERAAEVCNTQGVTCYDSGLPGMKQQSCRAFGGNIVVIRPYASADGMPCHTCLDKDIVLASWYSSVYWGFLFIVITYVFAVWLAAKGGTSGAPFLPMSIKKIFRRNGAMPHRTTLKRWVACTVVITLHYQTIVLIGSVRPYWPRTSEIVN